MAQTYLNLGKALIILLMAGCPFILIQSLNNQKERLKIDARLRATFRQERENLLSGILSHHFRDNNSTAIQTLRRDHKDQPIEGLEPFFDRETFARYIAYRASPRSAVDELMLRHLRSEDRFYSGMPRRFAGWVELVRQAPLPLSEQDLDRMYRVGSEFWVAKGIHSHQYAFLLEQLPPVWQHRFRLQRQFVGGTINHDPNTFLVRLTEGDREVLTRHAIDDLTALNTSLEALNIGLRMEVRQTWQHYAQLNLTLAPQPLPSDTRLRRSEWIHIGIGLAIELMLLLIFAVLNKYHKVNQFQKQLLAATSHELRTPLAVMRQFAEMLQTKRDQFPSRIQTYHQYILRECLKMQFLVENLLSTAKFEHLSLRPKPTSFDLKPWFEETCTNAQHLSDDWSIDLASASIGVRWDAGLMQQVLVNLLENGRLHAGTNVEVTAQERGDRVVIEVRDFGENPDLRLFSRIQAFKRSDHPETGLGLGLYLCHKIVKAHHGKMSFHLAEPGLRVRLDLPREISEAT
ncbi:HAMP domain-containing histidine kinase [Sulfidibacter corallicola]|uniref:histidine kinase n=1 Tax=Sulfidibacter corallicola TaxID=2818388 RepID=A0A8A4TND5_SULCO|nr:HAMP domain-containing sensor histidine kinase [Sulfidibacter corallicola]QTD51060.1 HAMP domain-containing histidine kinase [Sulfidibacter corallicola]